MKNILTIFFLLILSISNAQNQNYSILECQGDIPKNLLSNSTEKYKEDVKQIKEMEASRKKKKAQKKYSIETNFVLDRFMQSGGVLFNDKVSIYLNKMAQHLLKDESQAIKNKIKVYTLRSTSVNAFATSRGDVFVTLGLLAKLDNEDQLAFILSHELTHVIKDHSLELFFQTEGIKTDRTTIAKKSVVDDKFLSRSFYSKELEIEADKDGFDRFIKAGFDVSKIMKVFDILKYAEHPFTNEKFDYAILEDQTYMLKKKYKKFEADEIEGEDEEEDDGTATHPNLGTRKDIIDEKIEDLTTKPKSGFSLDRNMFSKIVDLAQLEMPQLYLHKGYLSLTIYTAAALLKKYPNNVYLKKCIGKAIYLDAKFHNSDEYKEYGGVDEITGEKQSVYNLLAKMKEKETNALALNYNYRLHKAHPKDKEIKAVLEDAILEAVTHVGELRRFTREETDAGLYWKRALFHHKKDKELKGLFAAAVKEKKEREDEIESGKKEKKKKGYRLGIDKVVIVNPQYYSMDNRRSEYDIRFINSEEGRLKIGEYIKIAADKTGLKTKILDVKKLKANDVQAFNDLRFLNDWFSEQSLYNELTPTPGTNQKRLDDIAKRYGTSYFLWTGVMSMQVSNYNYILLLPSVFFPPAIPFVTYSAIKPKYNMLYYSMIYDIETGRREVLSMDYFKIKDSEPIMKSHMYDTFLQIKTPPKKSKE